MLGKPFRRYVIAESETEVKRMVEADLGQLPYKVLSCADKGFTPDEMTPHISMLPNNV